MKALAKSNTVKKVILDADRSAPPNEKLPQVLVESANTLIIDSLLADEEAIRYILTTTNRPYRSFLLVHYLDLLDSEIKKTKIPEPELDYLKLYDGFITTSQYSRKSLIANGFASESCVVVRPGLSAIDAGPNIKKNATVRLLTVSSILPGKGLIEFLEVLESLSDLDWCWELVGEIGIDPGYFQKFIKQVQKCSVRNRITITGAVSQQNVFEKYRRSDIFALPSDFESCSMVTMEAMAFALPVIAKRVGGISELVSHTRNGYLVNRNSGKQFSDRLRALISDETLRIRFGKKGRELSDQFDSWGAAAVKLNKFIVKKYHTYKNNE